MKDLFSDWLETHFPEKKEKVLSAVRDIRDGDLNSADFADRMRGTGPKADHLRSMFKIFAKKYGLNKESLTLDGTKFRRPGHQLSLF